MIVEEIKKFLKGEVIVDEAMLAKYSTDYSIFQIKPTAVVFPRDTADLKNLVKFAEEKKKTGESISLTARSAGTDMSGGPLTDSIVVAFERYFNKIKKITDTYAIVEPGVYFRDLEKELNKKNLLYPSYPASKDICAIGGMIANNAGGEKTLAYGKTENYVEKLKVVMADGEEHLLKSLTKAELTVKMNENSFEGRVYKNLYKLIEKNKEIIKKAKPDVSKNSAGYALWDVWDGKNFNITRLIVGSQGTLGLVTEATLRLVPAKKYSKLVVLFLPDLRQLARIVLTSLKFKPESLESYDDKTFRVALRFLPSVVKLMKGNIIKLFFQFLPELLMVLKGGIPKMVILADFTSDSEEELKKRSAEFTKEISQFNLQVRAVGSELEAERYFTIRRQSFKLLHSQAINREAAAFIDDFIVKPEYLPELLPKLSELMDRYKEKMIYTIAGHPGDGNFHIIPLIDLKDETVRKIIPELMDKVYDLVLQYRGSITAEHNDGLIRTPYLRKMYGDKMVEIFKEVKNIFDPDNIFNPGKKVDIDLSFALGHLKR